MKIIFLNDSRQQQGGGWSFLNNLSKGLKALGHQVVDSISDADIAIVSGATMVNRDTVREVKDKGIRLVVRVDNIPRNSRNRNTGTSRLKDYAEWADVVVYQSKWAREYISDFVKRNGVVIHNSVDENIFKPEGRKKDYIGSPVYLYSRFNRDENKRYEEAWYEYQMIHRKNPSALLVLVGKFSPEHREYSFDFFRGERYKEPMIVTNPEEMAEIYRGCDYLMAPYYNDACSNTYIEALCCGLKLYKPSMTGGTPEIIDMYKKYGAEYFALNRMTEEYMDVFLGKGGD